MEGIERDMIEKEMIQQKVAEANNKVPPSFPSLYSQDCASETTIKTGATSTQVQLRRRAADMMDAARNLGERSSQLFAAAEGLRQLANALPSVLPYAADEALKEILKHAHF